MLSRFFKVGNRSVSFVKNGSCDYDSDHHPCSQRVEVGGVVELLYGWARYPGQTGIYSALAWVHVLATKSRLHTDSYVNCSRTIRNDLVPLLTVPGDRRTGEVCRFSLGSYCGLHIRSIQAPSFFTKVESRKEMRRQVSPILTSCSLLWLLQPTLVDSDNGLPPGLQWYNKWSWHQESEIQPS